MRIKASISSTITKSHSHSSSSKSRLTRILVECSASYTKSITANHRLSLAPKLIIKVARYLKKANQTKSHVPEQMSTNGTVAQKAKILAKLNIQNKRGWTEFAGVLEKHAMQYRRSDRGTAKGSCDLLTKTSGCQRQ